MNPALESIATERATAAERAILGTCLIRSGALNSKETESVKVGDFQLRAHRIIYRAMLEIGPEEWMGIELPDYLRKKGELESVGGLTYISELLNSALDRPLEYHVRVLKQESLRRQMADLGVWMQGIESPETSVDEAIKRLEALRDSTETTEQVLAPWSKFSSHGLEQIDWLVDGVIEIGANGFILGPPKSRKSWAAEALAVSLLSGEPWFGQNVRHRRCALISREDYAGTTARRIKQLMRGKDVDPEAPWIDEQFWLNSRAESRLLMLTDSAALRALISNLKARQVEFCILDVLGVMHEGDENEVKEMRAVLRCVERMAGEVGCQICIVHHARKGCDWNDTLSNWARGSSVIAGFAEFLMGCMVESEGQGIIKTKFDSKADVAIKPFYWQIQNDPSRKALELNRVAYEPPKHGKRESLF